MISPQIARLVNDHATPRVGDGILLHAADIRRNTLQKGAVVLDDGFDVTAIPKRVASRQKDLKHAVFQTRQL